MAVYYLPYILNIVIILVIIVVAWGLYREAEPT
jgi:hypothetical protein